MSHFAAQCSVRHSRQTQWSNSRCRTFVKADELHCVQTLMCIGIKEEQKDMLASKE